MLMRYPKITIITPSFNQGRFIEETITSVLDQAYPDLEFLIMDGGSKDETVDIVKKYEKHITYWVSEKDKGQSDAINKGIKIATGDIINWLCSDDYLEKNALFKIAETFGDDENIHVVSGKFRLFNESAKVEAIHNGTLIYDTLPKTIVKSFLQQPATWFRTRFFKELMVSEVLHWYMCYELWVKYLILYGQDHVKNIDDLIAHYRLHDSSKTEMQSPAGLGKNNKFNADRNTIMYSIAKKTGLTEKLPALEFLSEGIIKEYDMGIDVSGKHELLKAVVNYYLYFVALRYFYEKDKKDARFLLKYVEKNMLDEREIKDLGYLWRKSGMDSFFSALRRKNRR
jgi:glycosyltransferase involved in cell wall biosynthesis